MQVHATEPVAAPSITAGVTGVEYNPAPNLRLPSTASFTPETHLCYIPPPKKYTFEDLGISAKGICPIAITEVSLLTIDIFQPLKITCLPRFRVGLIGIPSFH